MPQKPQQFSTRQKMSRNTFEVFHYRDSTLSEVVLHHHDFYEVYFFLSGNVRYNIESRSYQLRPGDILLISPTELHQPIFSPERQNYERMVLWINSSFLEQYNFQGAEVTRCFDRSQGSNLVHTDGVTRELLSYLFAQLIQESRSEEYGASLYARGLLAQILVVLNRLALRAGRNEEPRENADSVVYRVLSYINDHYHEDLSLDVLANKFFISKYHLSREFGRLMGTSVYRYIIQKRLIMARQMMGTGMALSDIYQHCGFGDYSNFYRAFKAEYQMGPREYMEELKNESSDYEERRRQRGIQGP